MFVMTTLGQLTDQLPGAINQRELFNCLPEGSFCVLFQGLKVSKKVFFFFTSALNTQYTSPCSRMFHMEI